MPAAVPGSLVSGEIPLTEKEPVSGGPQTSLWPALQRSEDGAGASGPQRSHLRIQVTGRRGTEGAHKPCLCLGLQDHSGHPTSGSCSFHCLQQRTKATAAMGRNDGARDLLSPPASAPPKEQEGEGCSPRLEPGAPLGPGSRGMLCAPHPAGPRVEGGLPRDRERGAGAASWR